MKKKNLVKINIIVLILGFCSLVYYNINAQNPANYNRDLIIAEIQNMALISKKYFAQKPERNGGGNSFTGWKIPEYFRKTKGAIYLFDISDNSVKITATGIQIGYDNKNPVSIKAKITYANIEFEIAN